MSLLFFILIPFSYATGQTINEWTVACYFAADNNIGPCALEDIEELKTIGSTQSVKVVVQIDYWSTNSPSTCHRYFVAKDSLIFITDIGEVNTGDPQTLVDFGKWAFLNYPARHYLLVIWDHGNGWQVCFTFADMIGAVAWDETSGDWLSVAEGELSTALSGIATTIKRPLDILAFDACVMGGVEVMSATAGYVNFFVGSEDEVPLQGFPYDSIISSLATYPDLLPQSVADTIVTAYVRSYVGIYDTVSLARVDLSYIPVLEPRIMEFAQSLKSDPTNPVIYTARQGLMEFGNLAYVDMGEFAQFIGDNLPGETGEKAIKVQETIALSCFCQFLGPQVNGISVWFPMDYNVFMLMVYDYINLDFSKHTEWEKFLYKFYGVPDTIPPLACAISGIEYLPNNSFKLSWSPSYDLTAISYYELQELSGLEVCLNDGAESGGANWELNGFVISSSNSHTGGHSFFSFNGDMELVSALEFEAGAVLDFFYFQRQGVLTCKWSVNRIDWVTLSSITDGEPTWKWVAVDLPSTGYIKFEYQGSSTNWVYIDDIRVNKFNSKMTIYEGKETSFIVRRRLKSTYWYRVKAVDMEGNQSHWSEFVEVPVRERLVPYGYPSPFTDGTRIIYDIPESEQGEIYIYTVSGKLVTKLQIKGSDHEVYWNGMNSLNQSIASGIYICLLKTPTYTTKFKLAKVR